MRLRRAYILNGSLLYLRFELEEDYVYDRHPLVAEY